MTVKLNKGELSKQREQLRLLERLLPSLDLKRRQLTVQRELERDRLHELEVQRDALHERIGVELPMLADEQVDLAGLVRVTGTSLREENVVSVRLPVLDEVEFATGHYSPLGRPFWVDVTVERLREACRLALELEVALERLRRVEAAVLRVTQRVNLFERVLIPKARRNIAQIRLHLGEAERAAVVQAKLSKAKRAREIWR
jgi:V/A-type H+/Na+-transporting ATPase subunit D